MASKDAMAGLGVVDGITSFFKINQGKPGGAERALFIAAIAFSYGVWEAYVEDLAVELATQLSNEMVDSAVPESVRTQLKDATAWDLAVHPGWRALWVAKVSERAKGSGSGFGMNTADVTQVAKLFDCVGLRPFDNTNTEDQIRLSELVKLRGEVVHTARVPRSLRKADAWDYRNFVDALRLRFDEICRRQCRSLLGLDPSHRTGLP